MQHLWRSTSYKSQSQSEDDQSQSHASTSLPKNDPKSSSAAQAESAAWLTGHLNHLTPEQEQKLAEFKDRCEKTGYYTPAQDRKDGKPSHDDATMLRFLRARKFDVDAAFKQFSDTEDWRRDNAIEPLYENIDVDSYDSARRMYPQWTGRRDRRGIPVYVFEIKHLTSKNMAAYYETISNTTTAETHKLSTVPARMLRLFALYESLLTFVMPLCSSLPRPHPETPITSSNNIVDVSGVGLKQFWNLKGHMQDASVLATAHYPETLDRIFIIGAPAFFPTVWGWIKRWFDPVTTSKIFILSSSEVRSTLESFIDPSNFPKQYGGELDWKWGDMPLLDEPARELVGALETPPADGETNRGFIKGPVQFKGDRIEVLGSEDGNSRRRTIPVPSAKTQGGDRAQQPQPALAGKEQPNGSRAGDVGDEHRQSAELPDKTLETGHGAPPGEQSQEQQQQHHHDDYDHQQPQDEQRISNDDLVAAASAAAEAEVQPIVQPLPTPDDAEKATLENGVPNGEATGPQSPTISAAAPQTCQTGL